MKLLIADDHQLIREGIKKHIDKQPDMRVVAEAQDGDEALRRLGELDIDVAIIDFNMPGKSGIELLETIKDRHPGVNILVLSMYPEKQYAQRVFRAGASGYITKGSKTDEILNAIRKVGTGRVYVSQEFAESLASNLKPDQEFRDHTSLSKREFQILIQIGRGKALVEIAEELFLSRSTVNTYRKRLLSKLNLTSTADLIHYAIKQKLVD